MLPKNASKECREVGKCMLREFKDYRSCEQAGSCLLVGAQQAAIRTQFNPPPIPPREFDWSAVLDGYEGGDPVGYGRTEQEAIADLKEQLDERT